MPFLRVYVHFVWATKNRIPFLSSIETRHELWRHIDSNAKSKSIHALAVGGHYDHCHFLISLQADQTLSRVAGLIKGESSHWINKSDLISPSLHGKFEWQDEYFAESVSPSVLPEVISYIQSQDVHHQKISFSDELGRFFNGEEIKNLNWD